jgi:tetratricopeptide (TPR) repeat protein
MFERLSRTGLVVILLGLVAVQALFPMSSYDEWWHLATGRYILAHRTVPSIDVFSFTALGRPWVTHEWLFEVVTWLVWSVGGATLLILFKAALVCGTALFCWLSLRRLGVRPWVAGLLLALTSYLLTFRSFVRPHVLSEFLLAFHLLVYLYWRLDGQRWRHRFRLFWLLPVQLLWANSHSGVVLGLLLWIVLAIGEVVARVIAGRRTGGAESVLSWTELGFVGLTGAALLAVALLNPNGARVLSYPLLIVGSRLFSGSIMELQSPLEAAFRGSDFLLALGILTLVSLASFALARRVDPVRALAVLFFGAAAGAAIRNVPAFAVVALPFVGANIEAALGKHLGGRGSRALMWASGALAAALLAAVLFRGVMIGGEPRRPALGVEDQVFPVRAADLISASSESGPVFNTMEYGGYLIWRFYPDRRVFIDGRLDVYGEELFDTYLQVLWTGPRWRAIVDSLAVDWLVVAQPPDLSARTTRYIGRQAGIDTAWALVQWDDVSLTYVRRCRAEPGFVAAREYVEAKPYLLGTGSPSAPDNRQLLAEARRAAGEAPGSLRARNLLAEAYLGNRMLDSAVAIFSGVLAERPRHTLALQGLAMARLQAGRVPEAIVLLEKAVALEPQNGLALYNLGYARFVQADYGRSAELFEHALRLDPNMVPALNMLGEVKFRQGRYDEARQYWETVLRIEPGNAAATARMIALGHR